MAAKKKAGNKSAAAKNKATSNPPNPKAKEAKSAQWDDQKTAKNENNDVDQTKALASLKKELQIYKIELNDNIARTDALQQDVNELERKNKALNDDLAELRNEVEHGVTKKVQAIVASVKNEQKKLAEKIEMAGSDLKEVETKQNENDTPIKQEVGNVSPEIDKASMFPKPAAASSAVSALKFELRQLNKGISQNQALRAHRPFQIAMNFDIPDVMEAETLTLHSGVYNIIVLAKDAANKAIVASFGDADYLQPGKKHYAHTLSVTGLPRGKYLLELSAAAPFIDLEQHNQREIVVH